MCSSERINRTHYAFKRRTRRFSNVQPVTENERVRLDEKHNIYCIVCDSPLTRSDDGIEIAGSHCHKFTNPAGLTFQIACFSFVENITTIGKPTTQDSWFPPNAWQIVLCANCGLQLGWGYTGLQRFYGLISSRLKTQTN